MGRLITSIIFISLLCVAGCSNKKNRANEESNPCSSGYVLMVFMGEQSKPIYPVLIRSSEADTAYMKYIGDSAELFEKNNFIISETMGNEYMKKVTVDERTFLTIRNYILSRNTNKDTVSVDGGFNTFKIIFEDRCDSVSYLIDRTDVMFFHNLIDSVKIFSNEQLISDLEYIGSYQQRILN